MKISETSCNVCGAVCRKNITDATNEGWKFHPRPGRGDIVFVVCPAHSNQKALEMSREPAMEIKVFCHACGAFCHVTRAAEQFPGWKIYWAGQTVTFAVCPEHNDEETCVGRKFDSEKTRLDLLPFRALEKVGEVLTYGAKKYEPDNWRHVEGWRWRYLGAVLRHIFAWQRGERLDPESGLPHLAHAACCVLFLLELDGEPSDG